MVYPPEMVKDMEDVVKVSNVIGSIPPSQVHSVKGVALGTAFTLLKLLHLKYDHKKDDMDILAEAMRLTSTVLKTIRREIVEKN